jgi:hypothetical protein
MLPAASSDCPGTLCVLRVLRGSTFLLPKNNRNGIFLLTDRIEKHIIPGMFGICVRALPNAP